jgi:hypothetical protein
MAIHRQTGRSNITRFPALLRDQGAKYHDFVGGQGDLLKDDKVEVTGFHLCHYAQIHSGKKLLFRKEINVHSCLFRS